AEHLADVETETVIRHAPVRRRGERVEIEYRDIELDVDDFEDLGADFEDDVGSEIGTVGEAETRMIDQRTLVNYAVKWFEKNR
ncbi:MAG: AAC(3) family N-acetyltransferase, partial [Halodesulfurarchaeum sp.]